VGLRNPKLPKREKKKGSQKKKDERPKLETNVGKERERIMRYESGWLILPGGERMGRGEEGGKNKTWAKVS